MPPASVSVLSPLASPFVPLHEDEATYYSDFNTIYDNGVPVGCVKGAHAAHDILYNIPDQAIDEAFPPTAEDAAEMDAVDDFLAAMVDLSFLEDYEDRARAEMFHIKKRWEARREEGLLSKPRPSRGDIHTIIHQAPRLNKSEKKIEKRNQILAVEKKHRTQVTPRNLSESSVSRKFNKGGNRHSKPIQQPRKQN